MPIQNNYGLSWGPDTTQLSVELFFVRKDGYHESNGRKYGIGLFHHFKSAMSLCWPNDDHHRWTDAILKSYCENEISVFMGCSDSGKTWTMSKIVLIDYWCAPNETLWAVSTTEGRGAELRFWGCIKDLFNQARGRHDLPGVPLDYLKCITSDSLEEDEARSLRRGIIVIPCKTGGVTSGLAPYIGIKAPRFRHAGDEVAVMNEAFLNAYANWYGKENFRGMMAGNFMETDDPLGVAAEPEGGWDGWIDSQKTQTWKGRFYGANVVALDGRDSPNLDYPTQPDGRMKFPYVIGPKKLDMIRKTKGEDSWEWWSQCVGKPVKGMDIWRVLSKDFCNKYHASDDPIWKGEKDRIVLYSLDPAYGLGDLCIGRVLELAESVDGIQTLWCGVPEIIPIKVNTGVDAETQIAEYVVKRLDDLKIPYENCGFDSFGRGTLSHEFSKICGKVCPVPVDSSSKPTRRPVRFDLFIEEVDTATGRVTKRLKRCDEHYTKFVSEMYFSCREAIGTNQIRGLDSESIREGCARKFTRNNQNKIEIEPKEDMKIRLKGRSPDKMDNFAIGVEMARRLGFRITAIPGDKEPVAKQVRNWTHIASERAAKLHKSRILQSA